MKSADNPIGSRGVSASISKEFGNMQNEELTQTYLSKSEDELLKLLSESGDLMPEARAALFSEAARRGLKVPAFAESTRELPDIDVKEQALAAGPFIAEVLRTFHSRFWAFVKLV